MVNEKKLAPSIEWGNLPLNQTDLDFIYNYLLEKETPMTSKEISRAVVNEKVRLLKKELDKQQKALGRVYRPMETVEIGEEILFPLIGEKAVVTAVREGHNPDLSAFSVATFTFPNGETKMFAAGLPEHKLNTFAYATANSDLLLEPADILRLYGAAIARKVHAFLSNSDELFALGGFWFPKALLADVNPGYLNLAEAVLEMEEGVPVTTHKILEMIEYPLDSNEKLTEFSFNYALHNDERFDEVGPTGIVLWALKLLEPEDVRKKPLTLKWVDADQKLPDMSDLSLAHLNIHDELEPDILKRPEADNTTFDVCINYPHWKAGTLPLIGDVHAIFPTALETSKVVFEFEDAKNRTYFPGWVIIPENYVCGLKSWYRENKVIPGSFIRIASIPDSQNVSISLIQARSSKDWIRTALFDSKGRLSFETRQQTISTEFDQRMCIHVENSPQLDVIWEQYNKPEINFNRLTENVFRDLSRENPQGIVHFLELYAGVNMMHRCPPKALLANLLSNDQFIALDDFYFKFNVKEEAAEEMNDKYK